MKDKKEVADRKSDKFIKKQKLFLGFRLNVPSYIKAFRKNNRVSCRHNNIFSVRNDGRFGLYSFEMGKSL